jgi:enoyl-CoA hydratase/carnithine racemase
MSETEPAVVRERRGAVLVLRINRPEARNALNPAVMGGVGAGLAEAENDPEIRAVVLTGTGDRSFSAGMDLASFAKGDMAPSPEEQEGMKTFGRFFGGGDVAVPVVGAAQATAVAGGFELLLNCDCSVVAEDAKLGLPEVKRGLFAAGGGVFIGQRIPMAVALELTLTGEYISAQRGYELGLVNRVVPAAEVLDAAIDLAEKIARNGPLGLAATKKLVRLAVTDNAKARELHGELQASVFASEDAKEGSMAFIEKRDPVWKGK